MKKRTVSLLLVLILLLCLAVPAGADSTGVCFTAVDDTLLDLSFAATWYGGQACVPCSAFSYLGIYYSYFPENSTVQLFSGTNQLFFDLANGGSYSENGSVFAASAVSRGGAIYVPASFVAGYFGYYASYISGSGYGDIVRIKSGGASLTDAQFLDAAASLMKTRLGIVDTPQTSAPTPTPTPTPTPSEEVEGGDAALCFVGLPSEETLNTLEKNKAAKLCFLVTASEAESAPETVRRLFIAGCAIGIYCDKKTGENADDAFRAIFSATFAAPAFIASDSSAEKYCRSYAESHALAYVAPSLTFGEKVTAAQIEASLIKGQRTVALITGAVNSAGAISSYLLSKGCKLLVLRETYIK